MNVCIALQTTLRSVWDAFETKLIGVLDRIDIAPRKASIELQKKINQTLAMKLRNCDVGSAKEQYERFRNYCYSKNFPSVTKENTLSQIAFEWAQLPYEEN